MHIFSFVKIQIVSKQAQAAPAASTSSECDRNGSTGNSKTPARAGVEGEAGETKRGAGFAAALTDGPRPGDLMQL